VLYDITRPVTPDLAVWPGDTPYGTTYVLQMAQGAPVNVSAITLSAHAGTHADAPYHWDPQGKRMGQVPLEPYIGPATVIDLSQALPHGGPILPEHLAHLDLARIQRLLVKSRASLRPDHVWEADFVYLAPETAQKLVEAGLWLFGTDAPSVDPQESQTLDAHHILGTGPVAILEMLQLRHVPPGEYELIALPLKLDNDGSPVRAVLRTLDG